MRNRGIEHSNLVLSMFAKRTGSVLCSPSHWQVNYWLGGLMEVKSNDLYRMKGVLAIKDFPARFVFQG